MLSPWDSRIEWIPLTSEDWEIWQAITRHQQLSHAGEVLFGAHYSRIDRHDADTFHAYRHVLHLDYYCGRECRVCYRVGQRAVLSEESHATAD
jgi:hypothetical protein